MNFLRLLILNALLMALATLSAAQTVSDAIARGKITVSSSRTENDLVASNFTFVRGETSARVTIVEFSDFECPFCGREAPVVEELLHQYPNDIRLVFKHNPLGTHPNARLAHEAAIAASAQGKFWEMHDRLFANQKHLTFADLLQYATQLDLDGVSFRRQLETHAFASLVDRDLTEASALGVTATPTYFVNGKKLTGGQTLEQWKEVIEPILGITRPHKVQEVQLAGAPVRGPVSAPITIVEFSDFQCPFCARALPTIKEVMDTYPGQVKWVFKNYPLDFHAASPLAHRASMAAQRQGKFWEMHDLLFSNQRALEYDDLLRYARQLNLDMQRFRADLNSTQSAATLESDKHEGEQLGVSGTPTFFVNGEMLVGAQSLQAFSTKIEAQQPSLSQLRLKAPSSPSAPQLVASAPPVTNLGTAPKTSEVKTTSAVSGNKDAGSYFLGPPDAGVTLIWFVDLQSPLSVKANELVRQLLQEYPGKIRIVFKHRPLEFHSDAILAHEAVLAAGEQDKFWEMEEIILAHQKDIKRADLLAYAVQIGLDQKRFAAAVDQDKYRAVIDTDLAEARYREVRGTPAFFVNGKRVDGLQSIAMFKSYIDSELRSLTVQTSQRN